MNAPMLNDQTSLLSLLESRRSGKPRELVGPGPSKTELQRILSIAARAPDHGKLSPWRFVIVGDEQRDALEKLLIGALSAENPDATEAHFDKEREFAHQGAALIVLLFAPTEGHKIPVYEQQFSCGAAGMNLLHAAHAMGFVGGWVTGWRAYSPRVSAAFCDAGEQIAGFLFFGHPGVELVDRPRPDLSDVVRNWQPPD